MQLVSCVREGLVGYAARGAAHTPSGREFEVDPMHTDRQPTDLLVAFFGNAANTKLESFALLPCEWMIVRSSQPCAGFGPPQPNDAVLE